MVFWFKNPWSATQPRSEKARKNWSFGLSHTTARKPDTARPRAGDQQGRFIYLSDPADPLMKLHMQRSQRESVYADSDTETLASETSTLVNSQSSHGGLSATLVGTNTYRGSMFPPSPHSLQKRPSLEFDLKKAQPLPQIALNWWLHREPSRIIFYFDVRRTFEHIRMPSGYSCDFNQSATTTPITSITILYREHTTVDQIANKNGVTISEVLKRISKTMRGKMDSKTGRTLPHVLTTWQKNSLQGFHPDNNMNVFDLVGDRVLFAGLRPADPALIQARFGKKPHKTSNVFVAEFEGLDAGRALGFIPPAHYTPPHTARNPTGCARFAAAYQAAGNIGPWQVLYPTA
ncbi:hypothetical protein FRC04_005747 [Tulasnella sp. 424]|nr:hypothetical protein FRC04_005747 [Tulasnella sp. 424]KAG8977535.1 hypothetical protein FRC05_001393 [Tulasnella sp. 425]